jgi:hypothetical protein
MTAPRPILCTYLYPGGELSDGNPLRCLYEPPLPPPPQFYVCVGSSFRCIGTPGLCMEKNCEDFPQKASDLLLLMLLITAPPIVVQQPGLLWLSMPSCYHAFREENSVQLLRWYLRATYIHNRVPCERSGGRRERDTCLSPKGSSTP